MVEDEEARWFETEQKNELQAFNKPAIATEQRCEGGITFWASPVMPFDYVVDTIA